MSLSKEVNERVYNIIGVCMEVHKTLGPGYPVEYYKKALDVEFESKEIKFEKKKNFQIIYKDILVGNFEVDYLIDEKIVIVILCQDQFRDTQVQQVLRCLQLTGNSLGLLVNFGSTKIQYKRIIPNHHRVVTNENQRYPMKRGLGKTRENNPII